MKKLLTIFFCFFAMMGPAHSQDAAKAEHIDARVISAYESYGTMPRVEMGLDVTLAPGWYTYWRMPGDSGLAPTFDWSKSVNVKNVELQWPAPRRFTMEDMNSFGYAGQVVFPFTVTPMTRGDDITIDLTVTAVVCHDICVPQTLHLSKKISGGGTKTGADFELLKKAKKNLPSKENSTALGIDTAVLGRDSVVVMAYAKCGFAKDADLMIETSNAVLTASPEIIADTADKTKAMFKIKAPPGMDLSHELFGKDVTLILINGKQAVERPFTF